MEVTIKILTSFVLSFLSAMLISPLTLALIKRIGIKQTTLIYVEKHDFKSGTPTMGGVIFLFPLILIGSIYLNRFKSIGFIAIMVVLSYGAIGFLDDYIKVKYKQNKGLKAYQKIIAQIMISTIVAFYCFYNPNIGSVVNIPFFKSVNLGYLYVPFVIIVLIASTNAVNLTDRLDGLASKTGIAYFGSFLIILLINLSKDNNTELVSLILFVSIFLGALFAFLWQNAYPAKIFMGDTGSLAIGGGIAVVAIFSKNPILILIIGIMYVVTCISVIVQVVYFKITKKRIFKMAPLHHHLEYKGIKESKIVSYYTIITILFGVIGIYSQLKL